jgi:hypothetical protein
MSTYLLLRNNQESGPFTFEEISQMSLKSYDLLWVVGKSAAWRYPGEITEFKSFAPPIPGHADGNTAKPFKSDVVVQSQALENNGVKLNNQNRVSARSSSKSVYVNLPAIEKKVPPVPISSDILDPQINFKEPVEFYAGPGGRPSRAVSFSGKVIWIGTICLLFGAGILTGFFISDRRKFFSDDAKITQTESLTARPAQAIQTAEHAPQIATTNGVSVADSLISIKNEPVVPITSVGKRKIKKTKAKQDSLSQQPAVTSATFTDSTLKQRNSNNEELLYKKIKENPENYVNIVTGKYSTGFFGGVSAVPITLTNNSPVKLDLVVVSIQYIQNNEKIYKTEELSFFDIEPGETVTEKAPKSSRGTKISQRISVINSLQIDLHYVH